MTKSPRNSFQTGGIVVPAVPPQQQNIPTAAGTTDLYLRELRRIADVWHLEAEKSRAALDKAERLHARFSDLYERERDRITGGSGGTPVYDETAAAAADTDTDAPNRGGVYSDRPTQP